MPKSFMAACIAAMLFLPAAAQTKILPKQLTYSFEHIVKDSLAAFNVTVSFKGNANGKTIIQLPNNWGGTQYSYRNLQNIQMNKGVAFSRNEKDSSQVICNHLPNQLLTITYTLINACKDSLPANGSDAYLPIIKKNWYQLIGYNALLYPKGDTLQPYNVTLIWKNYPAKFSLVNSFGISQKIQHLKSITVDDLTGGLFTGGDFRLHTATVQGKPVYFTIRGQWPFADTAMLSLIKKTISFQRSFWNDYNINQYTISLVPFLTEYEKSFSYQGTGLTNSFATWSTTSTLIQPASFTYLFNHELMHHWIGHIITNENPEELMYWFSEGFTDYYARLNMVLSGLITKENFTRSIDSVLAVHYNNPVHEAENDSIRIHFWDNYIYEKLPYNRGALFAMYVDALIRQKTNGKNSLKDVMQQILSNAKTNHAPVSDKLFIKMIQPWLQGVPCEMLLDKHIYHGHFISLEEWNKATNTSIENRPVQVFSLGFTTDKPMGKNAVITAVDLTSNAYKAGMMAGDTLIGFDYMNNIEYKAKFTVLRKGEKKRFEFYPAKDVVLPQLKKDSWLLKNLLF